MSMFSDTAYDNVIEKIEAEIKEAEDMEAERDYISGLRKALEIVKECY